MNTHGTHARTNARTQITITATAGQWAALKALAEIGAALLQGQAQEDQGLADQPGQAGRIQVIPPVGAIVGDAICTGVYRDSLTWETLDSYRHYSLAKQRQDEQWMQEHLASVGLW